MNRYAFFPTTTFFALTFAVIAFSSPGFAASSRGSSLRTIAAARTLSNFQTELPAQFSIADLVKADPSLFVSDELTDPEALESFIEGHPFMGFISIGEHLLLLTRQRKAFEWHTRNFSTGESAFVEADPEAKTIAEFPGYLAYDLSKATYATPLVRTLAGTSAWDEGPNCWNLCQLSTGWAKTTYTTDQDEFNLWIDSPFSKPATSASAFGFEPKQGDLIVLRYRGFNSGKLKEVHCAVSMGFGLVFTKNGASYESKYDVMTMKDMLGVYLPSLSNSIEFRTVPPFAQAWGEWRDRVSPELKSLVEKWMDFEARHAKLFFPNKGARRDHEADQAQFRAVDDLKDKLRKEILPLAKERLAAMTGRGLNEGEKIEQFFWRLLEQRAKASYF